MAKNSGPSPRPDYKPRKVTDKRGGFIEPEGASPRFTGVRRGQYPKATVPSPEGISPQGPSGSHEEWTLRSAVIPPVATRETGDSQSRSNPIK